MTFSGGPEIIREWPNPEAATAAESDFLGSLNFKAFVQTHLYTVYCGYIERIIAHQCARFTGRYRLGAGETDWRTRRDRLVECREIEENIAQLRRGLKTETQFNRQVELNMRIKELARELAEAAGKL